MQKSSFRRWLLRLLLGMGLLVLLGLGSAWWLVRSSLPQLDGPVQLSGLKAPLTLGRDHLGTAVLQGSDRLDLARGLGYLHAQERFFEMDLTRRSAAGELSALFGAKALERDQERRTHRMRARLSERWQQAPAPERELLSAYTAGVNAGLQALAVRPWQYLLLRAQPQPWQEVDTLLVVTEMYWMLQGKGIDAAFERAWARETVGDALYAWLYPAGGAWDATLDGQHPTPAPLPTPAQLDLRRPGTPTPVAGLGAMGEMAPVGSNNWAIAGSRSQDGRAILADDMHLGLSAPGIWFRTQFEWQQDGQTRRAAGLTLPGAPVMVVGSNGHVAWGFTNAYGQWQEWVRLPKQAAELTAHEEIIEVKGGEPVRFRVEQWQGSPIIPAEHRNGPAQNDERFALRWVAHAGDAYNLALDGMLQARDVAQAMAVGQASGIPHQNLVVADAQGQIGWTIAGRMWQPRAAAASALDAAGFLGPQDPARPWLATADYPRVTTPTDGLIWTANSRQLGGAGRELIGNGGFDLGARSLQIRERLRAVPRHDLASAAAIHYDTEARLMRSWATLVQQTCQRVTCPAEALTQLQAWNGRADADQVGYRLVRTLRLQTLDLLWQAWTRPLLGPVQDDAKRRLRWSATFEYSARQAIEAQAPHLLPVGQSSWDALLQAQLQAAIQAMIQPKDGAPQALAQATWGQANMSQVRHVLSRAVPQLSGWLDMPAFPQDGDAHVPRVAHGAHGQSQRLVVSPGQEAQGILSMPGGQSGHPMSPFYGAGHADWVKGHATPLLAGPLLHRLQAQP